MVLPKNAKLKGKAHIGDLKCDVIKKVIKFVMSSSRSLKKTKHTHTHTHKKTEHFY